MELSAEYDLLLGMKFQQPRKRRPEHLRLHVALPRGDYAAGLRNPQHLAQDLPLAAIVREDLMTMHYVKGIVLERQLAPVGDLERDPATIGRDPVFVREDVLGSLENDGIDIHGGDSAAARADDLGKGGGHGSRAAADIEQGHLWIAALDILKGWKQVDGAVLGSTILKDFEHILRSVLQSTLCPSDDIVFWGSADKCGSVIALMFTFSFSSQGLGVGVAF